MIFVTGTDTGCGKTTVGRAVLAALRRRGLALGVLKPVETGCEEGPSGELQPEDAMALARAAGLELPIAEVCPYRLPLPASPERAAEAAGLTLDLAPITRAFEAASQRDFLLVEGAGGLLVPIRPDVMMPDLARRFGLPIVVVARDALGTVNHTLLTVEAVRARGLRLRGVILSETDEAPKELANAEAIARHGGTSVLGTLPYMPDADDDSLADAAEEALDLEALVDR
jgi:dethiobiotin synthetase